MHSTNYSAPCANTSKFRCWLRRHRNHPRPARL